jgi:hypothetical protein
MKQARALHGGLILFFIALMVVSPIWWAAVTQKSTEKWSPPIEYNLSEHNSCHISVTEPTIVVRLDDIRAYLSPSAEKAITYLSAKNISVTLGVIPYNLDKDKSVVNLLIRLKNNSRVEIAQHGYLHNPAEIDINYSSMITGNYLIQENIGIKPVTYIPPYNLVTDESIRYIGSQFKIIARDKGYFKEADTHVEIGWNAEVYDYSMNASLTPQTVLQDCNQSISLTNLCVLVVHPIEFENGCCDMDETFRLLGTLNATYATLKDVTYCT